MADSDAVLRVTNRLYTAAADPTEWRPALEAMADLMSADHSILHIHDGAAMSVLSARLDERDLARCVAAAQASSPSVNVAAMFPRGIACNRAAAISDREFERSAYYHDCVKALNGFHAVTAWQGGTADMFSFTVCRSRHAGDFAASAPTILQLALPHLTLAVDLACRLANVESRNGSLTNVLNSMKSAVILTDANARPVFANAQAVRLTEERDGLLMNDIGLFASSAGANQALRDAISAVSATGADSKRGLRLERPSRRPPLLLSILPIWRVRPFLPGTPQASAAIFIREAAAPVEIDRVLLADIFGLTWREAEVVALLAQGLDVAWIAGHLGLKTGTVRNHLKHAFEKTGMHNQAALVALVRGLAEP
jgi:DNA-binding CsgD family transcriptional regulator/PAS domain-containing protein